MAIEIYANISKSEKKDTNSVHGEQIRLVSQIFTRPGKCVGWACSEPI